MPIHLNDLDVIQSTSGLKSVLIVPCVMCPSVTVATREQKPFMRLFANPFQEPLVSELVSLHVVRASAQ
jgi:hypothetical protein